MDPHIFFYFLFFKNFVEGEGQKERKNPSLEPDHDLSGDSRVGHLTAGATQVPLGPHNFNVLLEYI